MSGSDTITVEEFLDTLDLSGKEDLKSLLDYVLAKVRRLTLAEAGTVFVCDPFLTGSTNTLTCLAAHNDEVQIAQETFHVPIDAYSIAGYTASQRVSVKIDDLYNMDPQKTPYEFNPAFDRRYGYQSVSMLSVPLLNVNNAIIGVIQLLNHLPPAGSSERYAPFREEDARHMESLSLMIGMIIERAALMEEVSRLRQRG